MINYKSVKKLEFNNIISSYSKLCNTIYGKEYFNKLNFFYDKKYLKFELDLLDEVLEYIRKGNSFPLWGFPDIYIDIDNIKKGLVLDTESAFRIYTFIKNSERLINSIKKVESPLFKIRFEIKYNFLNQIELTQHIFTDSGEISDNASNTLSSIRKKIKKAEKDFLEIVTNIANKYKEYLISDNYILKEDRYLLPVKLSKKNNVNGVTFGFSDSGKTILIEPIEIVEINNLLYQLKAEEEQEIGKILFQVTEIFSKIIDNIVDFTEIIGYLDFLNSKANLSFEKGYSKIEINEENIFKLNQFYHPLLENPVKNNIEYGKDKQFVVITGPNAGGKSVTLKAIGLIQMLFQAGFFVPVSAGSTLPIVEDILIDIGDMQSIEQSLSTFSSHILEIKEIIEKASEKTLILIDELGTATSPVEGESLAVSILDTLLKKGTFGIITSHFDMVKRFAMENKSTLIASMIFDEEKMSPKYILMTDIPGYSYAFEIALRLGLPQNIINDAKKLANLDETSISISKQLSNLVIEYKEKLSKLEKLEKDLFDKENEIKQLKKKYNKTSKEIERELLFATKNNINELKKNIENEIAQMKRQGYSKEKSRSLIENFMKEEEKIINSLTQNEEIKEEIEENQIEIFQIGDTVETGIFGKKGKIINIDKEKAKVKADSFIFEVPISQLVKIVKENKKNISNFSYIPAKRVPQTIDIRGKTVEEAKVELDFYFNEIVNSNYDKIYIIHGKGTGKLSNFVHQYLNSKKKIIDSFNYASLAEGGAGCTIVNLKQ